MNSLRWQKMCQITVAILKFFSLCGKGQNSDLAHFLEDEKTFLELSHIYLNYLYIDVTGIMFKAPNLQPVPRYLISHILKLA